MCASRIIVSTTKGSSATGFERVVAVALMPTVVGQPRQRLHDEKATSEDEQLGEMHRPRQRPRTRDSSNDTQGCSKDRTHVYGQIKLAQSLRTMRLLTPSMDDRAAPSFTDERQCKTKPCREAYGHSDKQELVSRDI